MPDKPETPYAYDHLKRPYRRVKFADRPSLADWTRSLGNLWFATRLFIVGRHTEALPRDVVAEMKNVRIVGHFVHNGRIYVRLDMTEEDKKLWHKRYEEFARTNSALLDPDYGYCLEPMGWGGFD